MLCNDLWYEILYCMDNDNKIKLKYVNKQLFNIVYNRFNMPIKLKKIILYII